MNLYTMAVLILSYEMFRMNASSLLCKTTNLGLLVVDEGHRLKNISGSLTLSALNSSLNSQCNKVGCRQQQQYIINTLTRQQQ